MRIVIAGAGDVGYHLAKLLTDEEQEITLIDLDGEKLRSAEEKLDVVTIKGNSTSYKILEDAEISKADLLISVTSSEEANLTTAIIGKHLGAKRTVARIQNEEYLFDKEKLDLKQIGIDELISPESLAAREIRRLLKDVNITDTFDFDGGRLSLVGLTIDDESPLLNKTMKDIGHLNPDHNFVTVAILRDSKTIIPHGENKFILGDHAYFIVQPEGVDHVLNLAGKKALKQPIRNIMIIGGSKVGTFAAKRLSKKYNVKLIEADKQKSQQIAEELPDVLVLNKDGLDTQFLEEENIQNMDVFIAVTGKSESNIIGCLMAKNYNVRKTIALVENVEYFHLSQTIGIDTMINKKLIAANFIFRYIRKGNVISLTSIHGVDAEVLEFIVEAGSKITDRQIKDLDFPKTAIIGGVVRDGKGYITMGDFQFRPNDRAVVLCRRECIHTIEEYFK